MEMPVFAATSRSVISAGRERAEVEFFCSGWGIGGWVHVKAIHSDYADHLPRPH